MNFYFFKKIIIIQKIKCNTLKKLNILFFENISKLKCNTRKIPNFHLVLKIVPNRWPTHTNSNFLKHFLKMKKKKSNTLKTSNSLISRKYQNWSVTRGKYSMSSLSKKYSQIEDKQSRFYIFPKISSNCKKWSPTPSKKSIILFSKNMSKLKCITRNILNFRVVLKILPKKD